MTTIELFLKLVRNALWRSEEGLPEELSANMAANILRGAKEQGVQGLVNDALLRNKVKMPEEQQLEMMVMLMKVRQSNEEVNKGLRRLKELFDDRGIDYAVVKGQVAGSYYPDPTLRMAGDIDYYCDAQNFPKAQEVVKEAWGIKADANGSLCHIHYDYKGIIYEGHFALTRFYSKKMDCYWQQLVDDNLNENDNDNPNPNLNENEKGKVRVKVDNIEVRTLAPTIHVLYVFVHLYSHLMGLGVGIRQFCDMAVMLHACREDIEHERLHEILRIFGMERAFRAVGCILTDYLGMPKQELGYELTERDRRYAKRIFAIVRYRGNMGHYNKTSGSSGWRHNLESAAIKLAHFVKLWPLAPAYSFRWIAYEMTKKLRFEC